TGKFKFFFKDVELRAFLTILAGGVVLCTVGLMAGTGDSFGSSLRASFFQVISMGTTSGYISTPYISWPTSCQMILITMMFIGGCAASTSGSIKVIRVIVMLKLIWR